MARTQPLRPVAGVPLRAHRRHRLACGPFALHAVGARRDRLDRIDSFVQAAP